MAKRIIILLLFILALNGCGTIPKNLVLYFNFNEGKGNTVSDKTHGLTGFINNPKWVKRGLWGYALEFDGNSFIKMPDSDLLKIDKFKIEARIKLVSDIDTWPGSYQTILSKEHDYILRFWNGNDEKGYGRGMSSIYFGDETIHANSYLPGFKYTGPGHEGHATSNISFVINRWYKIAMEYDGVYLTQTIDGKAVSKTLSNQKPRHSNYDLYIGSHVNGRDGFIGIIDDVKLWRIKDTGHSK